MGGTRFGRRSLLDVRSRDRRPPASDHGHHRLMAALANAALALAALLAWAPSVLAQPEVNLALGNLPPGKTVTVTFDAQIVSPPPMPTVANQGVVTGNFPMVTTGDPDEMGAGDPFDPTVTSLDVIDLALSKTESSDPVIAGSGAGNLTYVVTLKNNSMSDTATGVTVNEALSLPAGVSVDMITPSAGTFMGTTWSVPMLGPLGSATLTVVLTVGPAAAAGTDVVSDTATITGADQGLVNALDDTVTESTSIARQVDLQVSKTESADPVVAGSGAGNLVYTVTVDNAGPSDASGVALSEALTLPAGVSIVSIAPSAGTSYAPPDTNPGTWTVGDLAAGASATLTVTLTAGASTAAGTDVIDDTATVTAVDESDTNSGNDSASESTSVTREVDLEVTKTESVDPAVSGTGPGNLVYTVTVTNNGPSDASGVEISEGLTLPSGVTIDSIAPSAGGYAPPGGNPGTWTVGTLAAGASATLTVTLTVSAATAPGTDVIDDTATVTAVNETDTNSGNDSAFEATSVVAGDVDGPAVIAVSTNAGALAECDVVRQRIARIQVEIEDDLTAIRNADDPASFLLVGSGADGDFSTTGCAGGAAGDDVPIEIVSLQLVSVQPISVTAELRLPGSNGIAPGLYRFFVCDTVTDGAGNSLDGDGDMTPGGDFVVPSFRADPFNLFANGHFDDCPVTLAPWILVTTPPNDIVAGAPGTDDADGSPYSASARVMSSTADPNALGDCVAVAAGGIYDLKARARFTPVGADPVGFFQARCEFFSAAACTGTSLGSVASALALEGAGGVWEDLEVSGVAPPPGAVSALCDFTVEAESGASADFETFDDGLFLGDDGVIFTNGFESGDTSAWTFTVP